MASKDLIQRRVDFVKMLREARCRLEKDYNTDLYVEEVMRVSKGLKQMVSDLSGEATAALVLAISRSIPVLKAPGRESYEWKLLTDAGKFVVGEF